MATKKPKRGCISGTALLLLIGACAIIGFPAYLRDEQHKSETKTAQGFVNATVNARAQATRVAQLATETVLALTPSNTPTKTLTPTHTFTPTNTPTATPTIPPAQQTTNARNAGITATALFVAENRTATAEFKSSQATMQAEYERLDFREVRDKAEDHIGEKVIVRGRINNLTTDQNLDAFFMFFSNTYDNCYVVLSNPLPDGIYKDSSVIVYGRVIGYVDAKNGLGAQIKVPVVADAYLLINGVLK